MKTVKKVISGPKRSAKSSATINEVKQLVSLMVDNDISELKIEEGTRKIHLKRGSESSHIQMPMTAFAPAAAHVAPPVAAALPVTDVPPAEPASDLIEINSPMVGTFYISQSPDSDAYVKVGDVIGSEDIVCIVEAMKVMNEIKAECSGAIAEVCVKSGQPVEFGQVLFMVKPAN